MSSNRSLLPAVEVFDGELTPQDRRRDSRAPDGYARSTDRALRGAVAALLLVISAVHLHLWLGGYRYLSTIGPLFMVTVVSAVVLALLVAMRINAAIALAAASFAAGTLAANVLSLLLPDGLFHFKEVGVSYSGGFAIASEVGVVALLAVWTHGRFWHGHEGWAPTAVRPRQRANPT